MEIQWGLKIKKNNQEKGSVENNRRDGIQRVKDAWGNRIMKINCRQFLQDIASKFTTSESTRVSTTKFVGNCTRKATGKIRFRKCLLYIYVM